MSMLDLDQSDAILTQEFEKRFKVRYLPSIEIGDPRALDWLKYALKKKRRNEIFMRNASWMRAMFEGEFCEKTKLALELKFVNSLVGLGVYAKESLKRFSYVGEYTGVVRKFIKKQDSNNDYIYRYIDTRYRSPYVIDAEQAGNFCRFINHSDTPNLLSRSMVIEGQFHVVFYTRYPIEKGEQLTYDYGNAYWRRRAKPLPL